MNILVKNKLRTLYKRIQYDYKRMPSGRKRQIYNAGCEALADLLADTDVKATALVDQVQQVLQDMSKPLTQKALAACLQKRWPAYKAQSTFVNRYTSLMYRLRKQKTSWLRFVKNGSDWLYWHTKILNYDVPVKKQIWPAHIDQLNQLVDQIAFDLVWYKTIARRKCYKQGHVLLTKLLAHGNFKQSALTDLLTVDDLRTLKNLKDQIRIDAPEMADTSKRRIYVLGREAIMHLVPF